MACPSQTRPFEHSVPLGTVTVASALSPRVLDILRHDADSTDDGRKGGGDSANGYAPPWHTDEDGAGGHGAAVHATVPAFASLVCSSSCCCDTVGKSGPHAPPPPICTLALSAAIRAGELLALQCGGRAVVRIASDVVVKMIHGHDDTEIANLRHVRTWAGRDVPVPEPLGLLYVGGMSYLFMAFVPGVALGRIWHGLSAAQKVGVRQQLTVILDVLRSLPLPSTQGLLGGGGSGGARESQGEDNGRVSNGSSRPRSFALGHDEASGCRLRQHNDDDDVEDCAGDVVGDSAWQASIPTCKDARRHVRCSVGAVRNEAEFNAFLLAQTVASDSFIAFAKSRLLREDHRIVMTHGDLHPRNIMVMPPYDDVEDAGNGGGGRCPTISALVDWEYGGAYPEYWEYAKALSTLGNFAGEDWQLYLPSTLAHYSYDYAVDQVIDKIVG